MNDTATQAINDIMRDRASMQLPALLTELRRLGQPMTLAKFDETWDDEAALRHLARVEITDPEMILNLPLALAGRVFTHRLSDEEVERDLLIIAPDFTAVWPLLDLSPYDLIDNHPIRDDFDDELLEAVIRLRPGALERYEAGAMVELAVQPDGLHLGPAAEPDPAELARLTLVLVEDYLEIFGADLVQADPEDLQDEQELSADTPEPRGPVALEEFMAMVIARHEQIYTTQGAPIADVLEQLGLDHEDGAVAVAGFDFQAQEQARSQAEEIEMLVETYDLDESQAAVVSAFSTSIDDLHDAIHEWSDDDGEQDQLPRAAVADLAPLLPALSDPMVVVAIAQENLAGDPHIGVVLTMMLDALQEQVPRRSQSGFTWLQGRCSDVLGDVLVAEASYTRALTLDSDHFPAMRELATIASLRGDAVKAVSLLQRAGLPPQDAELAMVSRFAGEQRTDVGRNEDCWCGSGRKYKKCHLGKSDHDLSERWEWLYHKASHWVRETSGRDLLIELAAARAHPATDPGVLIAAVGDPLVMDVTLFEGGLLAEFLADRGDLLPRDELELATSWLATTRALYRVESISRAAGMTLENIVTGENVVVAVPAGQRSSGPVKAGTLVCLHLLPTGVPATGTPPTGTPPTGTLATQSPATQSPATQNPPTHTPPTHTPWVVGGGVQAVRTDDRELTLAMLALQGDDEPDPDRVITVLSSR